MTTSQIIIKAGGLSEKRGYMMKFYPYIISVGTRNKKTMRKNYQAEQNP